VHGDRRGAHPEVGGAVQDVERTLVSLDTKEPAQVHFVERMAESGASGLAFGLGTGGPPLTGGASRRADELALPLLTVPFSVPFTAIVRAVADANDREESRQLWRVARLYELLRTSVAAGRPGPETFRRLGEELGVRLYLVDPATGLSLFDDHQETVYAAALATSYAAHGNAIPGMLRLRLPDAAPGEICAVAVAVPGPVARPEETVNTFPLCRMFRRPMSQPPTSESTQRGAEPRKR